jgi:subtilisin-like proprotein convertase family protein
MKKTLLIGGFLVFKLAGTVTAAVILDENWNVNTAIPEGSPVGITSAQTFSDLSSSPITDVAVNLNISGGYNGDLYGYLTLQDANGNAATEILLNYMGTTTPNPFGSAGSGMNVTLSDSGTVNGSIHNAAGVPTGTWQPDSANALDGTFGGLTANGTWTLFLADMSVGGGTSTVNSWGLDINGAAAPEPADYGLLAGAGLLVVSLAGQFRRKHV